MPTRRAELLADLLAFVAAPAPAAFDALALRVARWQAYAIAPYGKLVTARGGRIAHWRDAPLVPTDVFRDLDLCDAAPGADLDAEFHTSGTTQGRPGVRRVPDLSLYDAAMTAPFVQHVLGGDAQPRPWVSLIARLRDAPHSSLSYMVDRLAQTLAHPDTTRWHMDAAGLHAGAAAAHLTSLAAQQRAVVVLATSFALVQLFDHEPNLAVRLPPGSRVMLTGGFKGRTREVTEAELQALVQARLGVPPEAVVPEYGMTELSSQAYGRPLVAPPWLKLRVVDPVTLLDLPPGEEGLVGCFDLLNLDNVSALLTSDLGVLDDDDRLTLRGRAPGALLRGCSLTAEELGVVPS